FVVPELAVKLRRVEKPATQVRKGRNPLTGEEIMIKTKPARKIIPALPLKALKEVLAYPVWGRSARFSSVTTLWNLLDEKLGRVGALGAAGARLDGLLAGKTGKMF
ncbi:MAG: HU family DNA-binding protein, partial [Chloroflexi bacterium]|nr:HU family DNA-binding protein [Chloroflexota bacterium]